MVDLKNPHWRRRCAVMVVGIVIMGLGVCLFQLSLMGSDPHSAMVIAFGNRLNLRFSTMLILINTVWFVFELIFGRKRIGVGTFFNWFGVGIFADMWSSFITEWMVIPDNFAVRLLIMIAGVLILSLSCAMYQTADLGVAPYDSISLMMEEYSPVPYFWCRMITDIFCTSLAVLLGGVVGIGTVFCAFGMGPFVNFFTKNLARKLIHESPGSDCV